MQDSATTSKFAVRPNRKHQYSLVLSRFWINLSLPPLLSLLLTLFLSTYSLSIKAQDISLLQYDLRDLFSEETHNLDRYKGKTSVIMFFEPECPFCFKQSKVLDQIQAECSDFQAIGVGVNGNRRDLQEEAKHLSASYPTYQVSSELQSTVGKVEGTPMMLVADQNGFYSTHLRGYQKLDALLPVLANAGMLCES